MIELTIPFEILGETATHAVLKHEAIDSENQIILTCDLYKYTVVPKGEESTPELVYADKAWIKGQQPFEIPVEEVDEISS